MTDKDKQLLTEIAEGKWGGSRESMMCRVLVEILERLEKLEKAQAEIPQKSP